VYYRKEKIEKEKKEKNRKKYEMEEVDVDEVKKFWLCVKRGSRKLSQIREKYVEGNKGRKPRLHKGSDSVERCDCTDDT
jgi:hypothetical protein